MGAFYNDSQAMYVISLVLCVALIVVYLHATSSVELHITWEAWAMRLRMPQHSLPGALII